MYCGIDEAGRGSVMGPLVVGSVFVDDDEFLKTIGVKDSKKLTPKKREEMYDEIISECKSWTTVVISAEEIDEKRKIMSLNDIELHMFVEGIQYSECATAYVDCPDVNEKSFSKRLSDILGNNVEIIAKHKADDTYAVVSAASIVAKVTRDRMIEDIREEFGVNIGSGYPSDHYTMDFIEEWIQKNRHAPKHVRCSWEPVKVMLSRRANTKLTDW